ncbi:replication-associated recombination protein A [bacterium]|nr:replication-associated recombination protein A [bacterium]
MNELFNSPKTQYKKTVSQKTPLAARMRPENFSEFVGQQHLLGQDKILRKIIESDNIPSIILYGPPGCGKTGLATLIAQKTKNHFKHLNAVTSTVSDVREVISESKHRFNHSGSRTILFLDEIAHFNKTQQDALLKDVEEGTIILLGATTHNPFFYINTPILSRAMIFQFNQLSDDNIKEILTNALKDKTKGLGNLPIKLSGEALNYIVKSSQGDARRALNLLEVLTITPKSGTGDVINISLEMAKESAQGKFVAYDRNDDHHYDTISAFIKSIRGSDPNAAIYWLAKMIVAGEDPRFIARRILICASEDVGNADPQALLIAESCYRAVEVIGMPESRIILAQAVIYISTAPKSNSSYLAINKALEDVKKEKVQEVPLHLQGTGYKGAEKLGKGKGYLYPHDFPEHYVQQKYMPFEKKFYIPSESGYEKRIRFFLNHLERLKNEREKKDKKSND